MTLQAPLRPEKKRLIVGTCRDLRAILKALRPALGHSDRRCMRSREKFFTLSGIVCSAFGVSALVGGLGFVRSGETLVGLGVSLLFGGVFGAIGFVTLRKGIRLGRTRRRLLATGMPVSGKVLKVREDTSVSVNDEHPWVVVAQWTHPTTGKQMQESSDFFWHDPSDAFPVGASITVLVDPEDDTVFLVDAGGDSGARQAA